MTTSWTSDSTLPQGSLRSPGDNVPCLLWPLFPETSTGVNTVNRVTSLGKQDVGLTPCKNSALERGLVTSQVSRCSHFWHPCVGVLFLSAWRKVIRSYTPWNFPFASLHQFPPVETVPHPSQVVPIIIGFYPVSHFLGCSFGLFLLQKEPHYFWTSHGIWLLFIMLLWELPP